MESNAKGGRGGQKPNAYFLYGPGDVDFKGKWYGSNVILGWGGLRKMVITFHFLATLNFIYGP